MKCKLCDTESGGRSDKKFCSEFHRNFFNNHIRRGLSNKQVRHKYDILYGNPQWFLLETKWGKRFKQEIYVINGLDIYRYNEEREIDGIMKYKKYYRVDGKVIKTFSTALELAIKTKLYESTSN